MPDRIKTIRINADINVMEEALAGYEPTYDKMFISYDLLHTLPDINDNGETYDAEATKERTETIVNGYVNLEHDKYFNVGSVLESEWVDLNKGGKITASAVLWKTALKQHGITPKDVKDGKYKISMEVAYKVNNQYFLWGDKKVEYEDASEELMESVGSFYNGKYVARVIYPHEFKGNALTKNPADNKAIIKNAVASIKKAIAQNTEPRKPSYEGTETSEWTSDNYSLTAFIDGYFKHEGEVPDDGKPSSVDDLSSAAKTWIAARTILGNADADNADDLIILPVVNPNTNKLNRNALESAYKMAKKVKGISEENAEKVKERCQNLLKKEFDVEVGESSKNKGGQEDMPYKEFETEEEFNKFKEGIANEVKDELKEDEEFIDEVSEDKIKEIKASYAGKLKEILDESEAEDIDGLIDEINETIANYEKFKEQKEKEDKFQERVAQLNELGISFDDEELEDVDAKELVEMSEASFKMLKKTVEKAVEESKASEEDTNDDEGNNFNPNNFQYKNDVNNDAKELAEKYFGSSK